MEADRHCQCRPVFVLPVVVVIVVPGDSPASPGQVGRREVKYAGWGDIPPLGDLLSCPLKAGRGLGCWNGGSGDGGSRSVDRVDESVLTVRPGQYIAGKSPLYLTSVKELT